MSVSADMEHQPVIGRKCEKISHHVGLQTADQEEYFTRTQVDGQKSGLFSRRREVNDICVGPASTFGFVVL